MGNDTGHTGDDNGQDMGNDTGHAGDDNGQDMGNDTGHTGDDNGHNDGQADDGHNDGHAGTDAGHPEVPPAYANLVNPYAGDPGAIQEGEAIYQAFCATCHGAEGRGDGPAAAGLNPPPANLADAGMMSGLTDGFLFWRVSEGMMATGTGASAMPAFGMMLDEAQIWQVIAYVRTFTAAP